jgi:hypothetical protein
MTTHVSRLRFWHFLRFVGFTIVAHVTTYLAIGMLAYYFVYKPAIDLGGLSQSTMRNPNIPEEWKHVETWLFPAQILRGALFGIALCPFLSALALWGFARRFVALLGVLLVFSVWSVTMPAEGSIEGWLYLRPGPGLRLPNPLLGYVEVPAQLAFFALIIAWQIGRLSKRVESH